MKSIVSRIVALIKSEPAVFLGALGSVAVAVYQLWTRQVTWNAIQPIITGFVVRFFVTPASASS